jgi:hypothetical protein
VYKCRDNRYSIKPPLHFLCFESANKSQINGALKIVDIVFEGKKISVNFALQTVVVAQLVRALDCGSRGREFEPRLPPKKNLAALRDFFIYIRLYNNGKPYVNIRLSLQHTTCFIVIFDQA